MKKNIESFLRKQGIIAGKKVKQAGQVGQAAGLVTSQVVGQAAKQAAKQAGRQPAVSTPPPNASGRMPKPKIFIDPGHGGRDPGAVGNGMREADIVMDVSRKLGDLLGSSGFDIRLSRPQDSFLTIDERWRKANDWSADYFISIHANAGGGTGSETFIHAGKPQDRSFAQVINDTYAQEMGLRNRGVKLDSTTRHGSLGVLRFSKMPALLIELGFIDSPRNNPDIEMLKSKRQEMATALAKGVFKFLDLEKSQEAARTPEVSTPPSTILEKSSVFRDRSERSSGAQVRVELLSTREVASIESKRISVPLTDLRTGERFNISWAASPTYHTDWNPMASSDTAVVKRILRSNTPTNDPSWANTSSWSWTPRPGVIELHGRRIAVGFHLFPHGSIMGGNPGWPLSNQSNARPAAGWPLGGHMCLYYSDSPSGSGHNDWARQMNDAAREAHRMSTDSVNGRR